VTITGEVRNAKRALNMLNFPGPAVIKWNATLVGHPHSSYVDLLFTYGSFIMEGGLIQTDEPGYSCISASVAVINDGLVQTDTGSIAIIGTILVNVNGGTINGNLVCGNIEINGGTVKGAIRDHKINISGGVVYADAINARLPLYIGGNAKVYGDAMTFTAPIVFIETTATVDVPLSSYISINKALNQEIVVGNLRLSNISYTPDSGVTLVIPEGASLELDRASLTIPNGCTLIIDGTLSTSNPGRLVITPGATVKGKNAGSYATHWWTFLHPFLQFLLRWFAFGWIWMR